jgi:hypothetical protein
MSKQGGMFIKARGMQQAINKYRNEESRQVNQEDTHIELHGQRIVTSLQCHADPKKIHQMTSDSCIRLSQHSQEVKAINLGSILHPTAKLNTAKFNISTTGNISPLHYLAS